MRFPYPIVLVDIGGTNVRLGLVTRPGEAVLPLPPQLTSDHAGLETAVRASMDWDVVAPRSMLACAAGPVRGRGVKLTNAAWDIDGVAVADGLGLDQGILFNDFEAQALSLPSLKPEWLEVIGAAFKGATGPRLIHGPGTGLGTAALVDCAGRWLAISSEASHSDFAPVTDRERALWPHVEKVHGRLTPEALISGPGLRRLHRAIALSNGTAAPEIDAADIINCARANSASAEADTVRTFWLLVARFAGDLALTFVATGGVILAGGILPRILGLLDPNEFRRAFENKAPYREFASRIPVSLLIEKDTVLAGLADIAQSPERYAIDFASRAWRSP